MNVKISKFVNLKILAITLSIIIAIMPFFQPKKVQASPLLIGIVALVTTGIIAGGYAKDVILTPEQQAATNEQLTANLQAAFPDPAEYNKQLTTLQNLDNDIRAGKDIDWSKYSGKALYAVLKGCVDVVWPYANNDFTYNSSRKYCSVFYNSVGQKVVVESDYFSSLHIWGGWLKGDTNNSGRVYKPYKGGNETINSCVYAQWFKDGKSISYCEPIFSYGPKSTAATYKRDQDMFYIDCYKAYHDPNTQLRDLWFYVLNTGIFPGYESVAFDIQNGNLVSANIKVKTTNKVKLPTRLPQSVINNINNYIDNSSENLILAPTADELPQLPDNYNPTTDELPDLPGYVDVTPDQEPTDTPDPTPTPVEPTPTPEGNYNGDRWVNPIGDFFDGLLKFMKAAFIPTLSLNLDALSAVPDNLGEKFPFSLPSDIISMVTMFQAEPVPIEISFNIPTHILGFQDIPIKGDTSFMDDYMPAIRNLIFLLFLFSLVWSTFSMFFGGGDD